MPLGIRPINDFAFKRTFGDPENKLALASLLGAILDLEIADLRIENPYSRKDFEEDKLTVLDVKATDRAGAIFHIEMQLATQEALTRRLVYYGCELFVDQLAAGDDYRLLRPVYSICLLDQVLWNDWAQVQHSFRLMDEPSGRVLEQTLELHTLELPKYTESEPKLAGLNLLTSWLYWLRHAQEYEPARLEELLPQPGLRQATDALRRISERTEDKAMYDAREKKLRDERWIKACTFDEGVAAGVLLGREEGKLQGKIAILQEMLLLPFSPSDELDKLSALELGELVATLQTQLRTRSGA